MSSKEHFDNATKAFIEALGHSAGAGANLEIAPPLAIYEGYKAIEAWKEMAQEYVERKEAEKEGK